MEWVQIISNSIIVAMLSYNLVVIKKLIEKLMDKVSQSQERLNIHDRVVSDLNKIPFDSAAISRGIHHYPIFHRSRRDS